MNNQTIIPGKPSYDIVSIKENIEGMAEAAAVLLYISICSSIIEYERFIKAKNIIRRILLAANNPYNSYMEFCERVLLFRNHLAGHHCLVVSDPVLWLKSNKGFGLTESWYASLKYVRISLPLNLHTYKALAEAALEIAEEPSSSNFDYWTRWFAAKHAYDELKLFRVFCSYYFKTSSK
ncbi:MAG TPA: hypothetical protein VK489_03815 [Ferruginibacter sp.]|nr:hypothetical protein [Ferruginibacter sp.]